MKNNTQTAPQKRIRRLMRRAFRLSLATAAAVSVFRLSLYAEEQRRDRIRREQRRSTAVTMFLGLTAIGALAAAFASALAELKRKNGGYAIDLFDRDEYDIVSPDEEDELECIMHGELDGKSDDAEDASAHRGEHIPVDDEATVENY